MADLLAIAATVSFDDKTNAPAGWGDALQAQLGQLGQEKPRQLDPHLCPSAREFGSIYWSRLRHDIRHIALVEEAAHAHVYKFVQLAKLRNVLSAYPNLQHS